MNHRNAQKQEVQEFFNKIATEYKAKYSETDAFRHYFFSERLREATHGFDFKNKKILDIGAGTGDLFDFLQALEPSVDYYASDISANMLAQSRIPADRQFVGACYETDFPVKQFDYIFMLGVMTYLEAGEARKIADFIHSALAENGRAIITFTNQSSLDWKMRKLFKSLARNVMPKKYVLSQEFQVHAKKLAEVENQIQAQFNVEDVRWLNHTVFPLSQILKTFSVKMAEKAHSALKNKSLLDLLSSDFLLILSRKNKL